MVKAYQQNASAADSIRQQIITEINGGVSLINYMGHGGVNHLAAPKILDITDVGQLNNGASSPLFLGLSCNVARYDLPGVESLAGAMTLSGKGGAIAFWGPTHVSNHGQAKALGQYFLDAVFGDGEAVLGAATVRALKALGVDELRMHSTYSLIGDPALKVR